MRKTLAAVGRKLRTQLRGPWLAPLLNVYPPYLGAGIRVREEGPTTFEVSMTLQPWNQNYLGTHFGGSLYSMCDPFFVLILSRNLGPGYVVWDKSARIRFRRPGRGTVTARFEIPPERIAELRSQVDEQAKVDAEFRVEVRDGQGEVVAEVEKIVQLRSARQ
jgi:acyl-coenzyme A thioesterase PaaI-like protein